MSRDPDRWRGRVPALALGLLALGQILTWLPGYLNRPYWADHDVFATLAQGWRAGLLPYRDLPTNQFPGAIYLFSLLEWTVGSDDTRAFYALDAALVATFALAAVAWGRRRFGSAVPGLVAFLGFAGYYFGLEHLDTAQRDAQAALLAAVGLTLLDGPARAPAIRRLAAALILSMACLIRPQAIVFVPSCLILLSGEHVWRSRLTWLCAWSVGLVAGLAPLAARGLLGDLARSLATLGYGGSYNRASLLDPARLRIALDLLADGAGLALAAAVVALSWRGDTDSGRRRSAAAWLLAWAGAIAWKAVAPQNFGYLDAPAQLVQALLAGVVAGLALTLEPRVRLALVAMALVAGGARIRPEHCSPSGLGDALRALASGRPMTRAPGGVTYLDGDDNHAEPPVRVRVAIAWRDYQDMITYLRDQTDPALPVANLLPHALPVTSVTRHRSLFPAESAAWLRVRPDQIDAFAQALRADAPALVVWSPALDRLHDGHPSHARDDLWPALKTIVRRDYQPLRSFGPLEVWRRKP